MMYNEIVERHAPRLGLNNLVTGEPCKPFVYMDYADDGMWVHYVTYCEDVRKQKRMRCLDMADRCRERFLRYVVLVSFSPNKGAIPFYERRRDRAYKWMYKWREISDKFKE